jgi:hypothetical protein
MQCGCLALRWFDQFHGFNHRASDSAFKKRDPIPTAKPGGFVAQLPGMVAVVINQDARVFLRFATLYSFHTGFLRFRTAANGTLR